jgi:uncharacterized protein YciI
MPRASPPSNGQTAVPHPGPRPRLTTLGRVFILELTYTAPLDRIDALLSEHVAWLDRGYADGAFLASGRKNPRDGGVVIATGTRSEVEARAATDPFALNAVCEYRIVEFVATATTPALDGYRESLPV